MFAAGRAPVTLQVKVTWVPSLTGSSRPASSIVCGLTGEAGRSLCQRVDKAGALDGFDALMMTFSQLNGDRGQKLGRMYLNESGGDWFT